MQKNAFCLLQENLLVKLDDVKPEEARTKEEEVRKIDTALVFPCIVRSFHFMFNHNRTTI